MEKEEYGRITDAALAKLKARIGVEIPVREPYFNTVANRDAIRHYLWGLGDDNPLWADEEYARKSPYGCLVAPPSWLYSVVWATQMGLPGVHGWYSGGDWTWFQPILVDDQISYKEKLVDFVEKPARVSGRIIIMYQMIEYHNQRKELVATHKIWAIRAERKASRETGKYAHVTKAVNTPEQVKAIYADYAKEEIRGSVPRYFEDVKVGDALTPVVKGPLSLSDMIAWDIGAGTPFMRAHKWALKMASRHPALAQHVGGSGEIGVPELVHLQDSYATDIGVPGAYDYGSEREAWLCHLLTNWAGDTGFVKKMYDELRLFNIIGDTTWLKGKVTKKYADENGEMCVDIDCWGENQRGEITMPGHATVILPSRDKKSGPLDRRTTCKKR